MSLLLSYLTLSTCNSGEAARSCADRFHKRVGSVHCKQAKYGKPMTSCEMFVFEKTLMFPRNSVVPTLTFTSTAEMCGAVLVEFSERGVNRAD